MIRNARDLVLPAFLFAGLILGGSAQAVWGNLALQLCAIPLLAWAAVSREGSLSSGAWQLMTLIFVALVTVLLQLVPLPPELWTKFPGREILEQGYQARGQELPWLPVSFTPYSTLEALLSFLPPLAVLAVVFRLGAYRESWAAAALIAGTVAGILLGYFQVSSGRYGESAWYLYEITNVGSAVGFFANRNHMGTLLLLTIPFAVVLFVPRAGQPPARALPLTVAGVITALLLLAGIALNKSTAAVVLALPVLAASALLLPGSGKFRALAVSGVAISLIAAIVVLTNSPVRAEIAGEEVASVEGRQEAWVATTTAITETLPFGTGLGSFPAVYSALVEEPSDVGRSYQNHAHNDYLELVLELGLVGALLILMFVIWWSRQTYFVWRSEERSRFARAATIASGAVMAHSLVDYPLRTAAIASAFAFCVAIMAHGKLKFRADSEAIAEK